MAAKEITDEQARQYLAALADQVKSAHASLADSGTWTVQAGSSLVGDDRASDPYQISHFVRSELGVAVEHLLATGHLLEAGVLHPMAPFTLVRSAIETASAALWVLAPAARSERITRRLRLAVADIDDGIQARRGTGVPETVSRGDRIARVQQISKSAGGDVGIVAARPPSTTTMVTAANAISGSPFNALLAWRVCSGIAHGRTWAQLSFLAREPTGSDAKAGVTEFRITSDLSRLLWACRAANDLVQATGGVYARRAMGR